MGQNSVFRWKDGLGWLVLSGGNDPGSDLRAMTLGRAAADGNIACISLRDVDNASDVLLDDMEDLGAPSGYIVDVFSDDDNTLRARLGDTSVVVIEGDHSADHVRSTLLGSAIEGIQRAYENGAMILLEGAAAAAFGAWMMRDDGDLAVGLGWVEQLLVLAGTTRVTDNAAARRVLGTHPEAIIVGVGVGSALVLGPNGEIETWGKQQVSIALGAQYSRQAD